jgi:hypothetical protein
LAICADATDAGAATAVAAAKVFPNPRRVTSPFLSAIAQPPTFRDIALYNTSVFYPKCVVVPRE